MVNYWKMFRQILDDAVDVCYVKLLAFWYSHQCMCIGKDATQIHSTFVMERLSPYLFKRYVRPTISANAISQSQLGCNIGGMFVNLFAYTVNHKNVTFYF